MDDKPYMDSFVCGCMCRFLWHCSILLLKATCAFSCLVFACAGVNVNVREREMNVFAPGPQGFQVEYASMQKCSMRIM